ncbi:acyl-CoA thioesterase [Marmoricola sp. RAF53]|uniref:acyl-CoA thioesterase n=1 Tax=Marmoricola sp. RAF53 TaxID=3233059 RepID=UPI003F9A2504
MSPETRPETLLDLLDLERLGDDRFRANAVFAEEHALYGGQVAAQALLVAGRTVEDDRLPHSLHGYFLRAGDPSQPTEFRVDRDRDGRSFSARRVVAVQRDEVIFSMSSSFAVPGPGMDEQAESLPEVTGPEESLHWEAPRLFSLAARIPPEDGIKEWPSRFWSRFTAGIGDDPLLNAVAMTYLTDFSAALHTFETDGFLPAASLDHAVWFHRPVRMDDWVFTTYDGTTIAGNRGLYTGSYFDRDGRLVASMAQEALYRKVR